MHVVLFLRFTFDDVLTSLYVLFSIIFNRLSLSFKKKVCVFSWHFGRNIS